MTAMQFAAVVKADTVRHFKDPASVQWRGVFVSDPGRGWRLCGELNAKNAYGAYVGFTRVIATPAADNGSSIERDFSLRTIFAALWQQDCHSKIADVD